MAAALAGSMIYGSLSGLNGESSFLPKAIIRALCYLRECDFSKLENKKYEIDGEDIFMMLNEYETNAPADKKAEQHRAYVDLHYIVSGQEMIGWGQADDANEVDGPYDIIKERVLYRTVKDEVYFSLKQGAVVLFFPEDIHRPGLDYDGKQTVKKAVIKIKAELCLSRK